MMKISLEVLSQVAKLKNAMCIRYQVSQTSAVSCLSACRILKKFKIRLQVHILECRQPPFNPKMHIHNLYSLTGL